MRISDVYPDGRSILIADYLRRARYRNGWESEALLEPDRTYRLRFDIGSLSQVFNRGHRIRITVASTGAPLYEPRLRAQGLERRAHEARIFQGSRASRASTIRAPQPWQRRCARCRAC